MSKEVLRALWLGVSLATTGASFAEGEPTSTPNDPIISPSQYGLKADYTPKNLQRALLMAGYDIGRVDGALGKTTKVALGELTSKYSTYFKDIDFENENAFSDVYQVIREAGPYNLVQSDARVQVSIRATDARPRNDTDNRTMVVGEIILTDPITAQTYYILHGDLDGNASTPDGYEGRWLPQENVEPLRQEGYDVFFPRFNSGGLSYKGDDFSTQKATGAWNPFDGSAIPGLGGGAVFKLNWDNLHANADIGQPSFAGMNGKQSWLETIGIDPEVVGPRKGIGMHPDGKTVEGFNDGSAGCIAIQAEYAGLFFDALDKLNFDLRPTHLNIIAPASSAPAPHNLNMNLDFTMKL